MTKEIQIRSWVNPNDGETEFIQTHVEGVIGIEEKIQEEIQKNETHAEGVVGLEEKIREEIQKNETHAEGVVGLEEKIREEIQKNETDAIILRSPEGQKFMLTVDNGGELGTVKVEEG